MFTHTRLDVDSINRAKYPWGIVRPPRLLNFAALGGPVVATDALNSLDDMLAVREVEEMVVHLRSGGYEPLTGYDQPAVRTARSPD